MKKRLAIAIIFSLFLTTLVLNGCSDESTSLSFPKSELPLISFQGFKIPNFPTARGQLNNAKSGFANSEEKKAALQILSKIFPDNRLQCGHAALSLAYMNLGY
ncbi:MAG: hypothetical protein K8S13_00040, partial [Desulfobacula sp.]|uniref:hypothetical protein n=1 Tax=Desulfobacula sp. TaxID=2593537 RepID=UPI0025BF19E0